MINGLSGHWAGMDKMIMAISRYGPVKFGLYLIGLWFSGESTNMIEQNRKQVLYAIFSALLVMGINQVIIAAAFGGTVVKSFKKKVA